MAEAITSFSGPYRWLSNFWPVRIEWMGLEWSTLEHAYQATKAANYEDVFAIQEQETPGRAKRLGSKIPVRSDWENIKVDAMRLLLRRKFAPGTQLEQLLLETDDAFIVEGNSWHDTFWGVCSCMACPPGENILGQLLMEIRQEAQSR